MSDLVRNGSDVVIGLGGIVPLPWGGVVVRLVVLALQANCQLKRQPHGGGGGALDLVLQVTGTLAGHCRLGLLTSTPTQLSWGECGGACGVGV